MLSAVGYLTAFHPGFWVALGAVLGAVMGSFFTCAVYRLPRGLSLRHPAHSFCPACDHRLGVPDLVPVFSWLALRGHCRHCGGAIPVKSLALEIAATLTGAALAWLFLHL